MAISYNHFSVIYGPKIGALFGFGIGVYDFYDIFNFAAQGRANFYQNFCGNMSALAHFGDSGRTDTCHGT